MEKEYKKGETLFSEGHEPDAIWMVRDGRVNMSKSTAEGSESMVAFYTAGQTFCVAATIINAPYPCKAVAATPVTTISIPTSRLMLLKNQGQ